jgi:hypothetical protein
VLIFSYSFGCVVSLCHNDEQMKHLKLSAKDRADIKQFRLLSEKGDKPFKRMNEFNEWAKGVTLCKPENLVVTKSGELSIRKLPEVLRPVYRQARTKAFDKTVASLKGRSKAKTKIAPDYSPGLLKAFKTFYDELNKK